MTEEIPQLNGPVVEPADGEAPRRMVILLHGYGADGQDLIGLAPPLQQLMPDTIFVAPNAPEACSMNPGGYQWFPIPWMDSSTEAQMAQGFARSAKALDVFLGQALEKFGLDESQLILIGFSQGTMMSLHVGPRRKKQLAAIIGFSGRLADADALKRDIVTKPPVMLIHGAQDEMIPVDALEDARKGLEAAGIDVQTHVAKDIGHGIDQDGFEQAARFIVSLQTERAG